MKVYYDLDQLSLASLWVTKSSTSFGWRKRGNGLALDLRQVTTNSGKTYEHLGKILRSFENRSWKKSRQIHRCKKRSNKNKKTLET